MLRGSRTATFRRRRNGNAMRSGGRGNAGLDQAGLAFRGKAIRPRRTSEGAARLRDRAPSTGDRHDRSGRSASVPVRQGVFARQQRRQARLSAAGGRVVPGCIMRMDQGWRMCRASCRFSLRITRNQRCARMGKGMIVIMGHNALRGGGMGDKHRNRQDRDRTRQHLPDGRSPRADRCRLHGSCNADRRDLFQITAWPLSRKNG